MGHRCTLTLSPPTDFLARSCFRKIYHLLILAAMGMVNSLINMVSCYHLKACLILIKDIVSRIKHFRKKTKVVLTVKKNPGQYKNIFRTFVDSSKILIFSDINTAQIHTVKCHIIFFNKTHLNQKLTCNQNNHVRRIRLRSL